MNETGVLTTEQFDLNNCDREPIHISGAIQPHGLLFVLQEPDLTILQVSKNTFNLLGRHPEKLLNKKLNILLDEYNIDLLKSCLSQEDIRNKNPIKFTIKIEEHRNALFDGIIHRHDGLLILELEPSRFADNISFLNFYDLVKSSVSKLQNASNLDGLCQSIVKEVRKINGFDRVMIYRFNQDGDGTIIAEDKSEKLNSFLG
jgi:light-regulated signal transduction histidine kinase (bacteriophytochrome)